MATRLWPSTAGITKQLLPVYDKPMIYYGLSTVLRLGCTDIALVCNERDWPAYQRTFEFLTGLGLRITPLIQDKPRGIAHAYILAEDWLNGESSYLVLGDSILVADYSTFTVTNQTLPTIWTKTVVDPSRYGVVSYDRQHPVFTEKPQVWISNQAITGFYHFPGTASAHAQTLTVSPRGQLEVTDLIASWSDVIIKPLNDLDVWTDSGTSDSLVETSVLIKAMQQQLGCFIGSPEIALMQSNAVSVATLRSVLAQYTSYHGLTSGYYVNLSLWLDKFNR